MICFVCGDVKDGGGWGKEEASFMSTFLFSNPAKDVQKEESEKALQEALRKQKEESEREMREAIKKQKEEHERNVKEALRKQQEESQNALKDALRKQKEQSDALLQEALQKQREEKEESDLRVKNMEDKMATMMKKMELLDSIETENEVLMREG